MWGWLSCLLQSTGGGTNRILLASALSSMLCTIVYKCLHAAAPPYLSELCIPVSTSVGRHFLRSATYGDLLVPRMSTSTYGPRSFAVSGLSVWNVTCDSACITDTWTVSKQAEGSTFSLGLRDMTRRVRDCLGWVAPYKFSYLLTYLHAHNIPKQGKSARLHYSSEFGLLR